MATGGAATVSQLLDAVLFKLRNPAGATSELDHLTQLEINELVKKAHSAASALTETRNMRSPINCLPAEILGYIFDLVRVAGPRNRGLPVGYHWIAVLKVCHRWHEVAVHHLALWTSIDASNPEAIRTSVERSGSLSLGIFLKDHRYVDNILPLLCRAVDLVLVVSSETNSLARDDLPRFCEPAFRLRSLTIQDQNKGPGDAPLPVLFGGHTPSLTHLYLQHGFPSSGNQFSDVKELVLSQTPSLTRPPSLPVIIDYLRQFAKLEVLTLIYSGQFPQIYVEHPVVLLSALHTLSLEDGSRDFFRLAANIVTPALTTISISAEMGTSLYFAYGRLCAAGLQDTGTLRIEIGDAVLNSITLSTTRSSGIVTAQIRTSLVSPAAVLDHALQTLPVRTLWLVNCRHIAPSVMRVGFIALLRDYPSVHTLILSDLPADDAFVRLLLACHQIHEVELLGVVTVDNIIEGVIERAESRPIRRLRLVLKQPLDDDIRHKLSRLTPDAVAFLQVEVDADPVC